MVIKNWEDQFAHMRLCTLCFDEVVPKIMEGVVSGAEEREYIEQSCDPKSWRANGFIDAKHAARL